MCRWQGYTPLLAAAKLGHVWLFQLLEPLPCCKPWAERDPDGASALHLLMGHELPEGAEWLRLRADEPMTAPRRDWSTAAKSNAVVINAPVGSTPGQHGLQTARDAWQFNCLKHRSLAGARCCRLSGVTCTHQGAAWQQGAGCDGMLLSCLRYTHSLPYGNVSSGICGYQAVRDLTV